MFRILLTSAAFAVSILLHAQKAPSKFGEVPMEDVKMRVYSKDSSASAVILLDFGESSIVYDQSEEKFVLEHERLQRIKILTKAGLEYANFTIPLYSDGRADETISGLKAITYNVENGKVVETKLKSDAVFKEKFDENLSYTKATMPGVKEGSVVEIAYRIKSEFLFNFQDWAFQSTIPVVWSEYRARIPEYFNYDKFMQGYIPLEINEQTQMLQSITFVTRGQEQGYNSFVATKSAFKTDRVDYNENRFRWVAKEVPAFKEEPHISSLRNFVSKIDFELAFTKFPNQPMKRYMGSWEDINHEFTETYAEEINGNNFLKSKAEELVSGLNSGEAKIAAITNYVSQNIQWEGSRRKYLSKSVKKVIDDKRGSSSEINILLASMLQKAGFSVAPVLLSTRDHGFVRQESPMSSQFNYVVCSVVLGEKRILLDATENLIPIGALPERCLNEKGLLISKEGFQWIPLQSWTKSRTIVNADLMIKPDASLKGMLQFDMDGYDALNERKKYFSKSEGEYIKELFSEQSWEVRKSEIVNAKEVGKLLRQKHEVVMNEQVTTAGDVIYINPILVNRQSENPFKLENRAYPVDFGAPFDKFYICKLTIPEGYKIDELPKQRVLGLLQNAGKFTYSATQSGTTINIVCNLQINKSIFDQSEYQHLREFYSQVVAKQAEQIVLKKE